MKKTSAGLIASLIFLVVTIAAFYWLWSSSQSSTSSASATSYYQVIDIEGIKKQATNLISSRENNGNIPIAVPTEKMNKKTNPFLPY